MVSYRVPSPTPSDPEWDDLLDATPDNTPGNGLNAYPNNGEADMARTVRTPYVARSVVPAAGTWPRASWGSHRRSNSPMRQRRYGYLFQPARPRQNIRSWASRFNAHDRASHSTGPLFGVAPHTRSGNQSQPPVRETSFAQEGSESEVQQEPTTIDSSPSSATQQSSPTHQYLGIGNKPESWTSRLEPNERALRSTGPLSGAAPHPLSGNPSPVQVQWTSTAQGASASGDREDQSCSIQSSSFGNRAHQSHSIQSSPFGDQEHRSSLKRSSSSGNQQHQSTPVQATTSSLFSDPPQAQISATTLAQRLAGFRDDQQSTPIQSSLSSAAAVQEPSPTQRYLGIGNNAMAADLMAQVFDKRVKEAESEDTAREAGVKRMKGYGFAFGDADELKIKKKRRSD